MLHILILQRIACHQQPVKQKPVNDIHARFRNNDLKYRYVDEKAGVRDNNDFPHRY